MPTDYPLERIAGQNLTAEQGRRYDAIASETDRERLKEMLREVFEELYRSHEAGVVTIVLIYRRLRELKTPQDELDELKIIPYLDKMADGIVLTALYAKYDRNLRLLAKLVRLTPEQQQRFVEDDSFRVMEGVGENNFRLVKARELTRLQIDQLFSDEGLRTDLQQVQYLSDLRKRGTAPPQIEDPFRMIRSRGVIRVKTKCLPEEFDITKAQIKRWYREFFEGRK